MLQYKRQMQCKQTLLTTSKQRTIHLYALSLHLLSVVYGVIMHTSQECIVHFFRQVRLQFYNSLLDH